MKLALNLVYWLAVGMYYLVLTFVLAITGVFPWWWCIWIIWGSIVAGQAARWHERRKQRNLD